MHTSMQKIQANECVPLLVHSTAKERSSLAFFISKSEKNAWVQNMLMYSSVYQIQIRVKWIEYQCSSYKYKCSAHI